MGKQFWRWPDPISKPSLALLPKHQLWVQNVHLLLTLTHPLTGAIVTRWSMTWLTSPVSGYDVMGDSCALLHKKILTATLSAEITADTFFFQFFLLFFFYHWGKERALVVYLTVATWINHWSLTLKMKQPSLTLYYPVACGMTLTKLLYWHSLETRPGHFSRQTDLLTPFKDRFRTVLLDTPWFAHSLQLNTASFLKWNLVEIIHHNPHIHSQTQTHHHTECFVFREKGRWKIHRYKSITHCL